MSKNSYSSLRKNIETVRYIANIQGLSVGDRARCGEYGVVECYQSAADNKYGRRMFKVSKSTKVRNGGGHTMKSLRKAIEG